MLSPIMMQRLLAGEKINFTETDWEGFISPDSEMIHVVSGDHTEKAVHLLEERYGLDYECDPVDDLVALGWIILHKCCTDTNSIQYPPHITEEQKNALLYLDTFGEDWN